MAAVLHPRFPARRATGATPWWGKAWARAVEEASYGHGELRTGRDLARGGRVGQVATDAGSFRAAVEDERGLWPVSGTLPVLDTASLDALVETVAAEPGRITALLAGDLPHGLVEHAEEAGVELLPYGGELATACTCGSWTDPCSHGLAVLVQVGWLVEQDPLVLLQLRGLARDDLLARLHGRAGADGPAPDGPPAGALEDPDLEAATEAALRAARMLQELDGP